VFVDTDHGFDLGYDPDVTDVNRGVIVARRRGDAHDFALWRRLGRPRAFEYTASLVPHAPEAQLVAFSPHESARVEAEAEWPPLAIEGGYAEPTYPPCASSHRALALRPAAQHTLRVRVELPVSEPGKYRIRSRWVTAAAPGVARLVTSTGLTWAVELGGRPNACEEREGPVVQLSQPTEYIDLITQTDQQLDYLELVPDRPPNVPE
jgi:hypothetical protein